MGMTHSFLFSIVPELRVTLVKHEHFGSWLIDLCCLNLFYLNKGQRKPTRDALNLTCLVRVVATVHTGKHFKAAVTWNKVFRVTAIFGSLAVVDNWPTSHQRLLCLVKRRCMSLFWSRVSFCELHQRRLYCTWLSSQQRAALQPANHDKGVWRVC